MMAEQSVRADDAGSRPASGQALSGNSERHKNTVAM